MTDKERLREVVKLADAMYHAAQYMTTDASILRKAMEEYHRFIITEYNKQEPASEDLEKVAIEYANHNKSEWETCSGNWDDSDELEEAFKAGAEWQKKQMMKDAIDAVVVESYGVDKVDGKWENVILPKIQIWSDKLSIGDKVKIIIIKE